MAKCGAPKADGTPCKVDLPPGDPGPCLWHDPKKKDQALAARRRGATKTNTERTSIRTVDPDQTPGPPPETIEDVLKWLSWGTLAVATGRLDSRTGHELAFMLRAFLDGRRYLDKTDDRIRTLEARLRKLREAG